MARARDVYELGGMCEEWLDDKQAFADIVASAFELLGNSSDEMKKRFARHFGASLVTIERWANGDNRPGSRFQGTVVKYIQSLCAKT